MFDQDRREFLGTATGVAAFTIVQRHVLGGQGNVAPSDKITLAMIGVGTQALRELRALLSIPDIRIVSVCDPCKNAVGYYDWSTTGILSSIRTTLGKPEWRAGSEGTIPGGRDFGKDAVDTYYGSAAGKGCSSYAEYRELLDKEKDLNAVKIMTPDHLHAVASVAAMRRGKHVIVHKPIANRLHEAKLAVETARKTGVATRFLPWDSNGYRDQVMGWIKDGAIGTLREIHNWTNRPVWPQYSSLPTDTPPVPAGFDWDLWLGPISVEPMVGHDCVLKDGVSSRVKNDFSFPAAGVVRFRYPARGQRPAVEGDVRWRQGQGSRGVLHDEPATDPQEKNARLRRRHKAPAPPKPAGRDLAGHASLARSLPGRTAIARELSQCRPDFRSRQPLRHRGANRSETAVRRGQYQNHQFAGSQPVPFPRIPKGMGD